MLPLRLTLMLFTAIATRSLAYISFHEVNSIIDNQDAEEASGIDPTFDIPILNVTVIAGQTAVLPCSIEFLGKSKVIWVDPQAVPLTYEEKRVVDDFRVSLVRPVPKEWNLQITEVGYEDQGQYMCSVNTVPIKTKLVNLYVKIPPAFIDSLSSHDQTVLEGDEVFLVCNATGVPPPEITWYQRRSSQPHSAKEMIVQTGAVINIKNISRHCHDEYECVASNGVPNDISRLIKITVVFRPEVTIRPKRLGQVLGRETILECSVTANPLGITYWEKGGLKVRDTNSREIEAFKEDEHVVILTLTIRTVEKEDWGIYKCVGSNSLGTDENYMELYEYVPSRRKATSTTSLSRYAPLLRPASHLHPDAPSLHRILPQSINPNHHHHSYNVLAYDSTASRMSQKALLFPVYVVAIPVLLRLLKLF